MILKTPHKGAGESCIATAKKAGMEVKGSQVKREIVELGALQSGKTVN